MAFKDDFREMIADLAGRYAVPPVAQVYFPPFYPGGQPQDAEFMALALEGGAVGVSYVLLDDGLAEAYKSLQPGDLAGTDAVDLASAFGSEDPIKNMLGLGAINAVCQHIIRETGFQLDTATDSLGLLDIRPGDRIGMVGLFGRLVPKMQAAGAEVFVLELNEQLMLDHPELPITLDPAALAECNKILCTSITVFNNTLDAVLGHCGPDAMISIVGPTAGYLPDPLFKRGVDVVGGTYIHDGELFMRLIAERKKWGPSTRKFCFQKATYKGLL